jgi:hypothetical protein
VEKCPFSSLRTSLPPVFCLLMNTQILDYSFSSLIVVLSFLQVSICFFSIFSPPPYASTCTHLASASFWTFAGSCSGHSVLLVRKLLCAFLYLFLLDSSVTLGVVDNCLHLEMIFGFCFLFIKLSLYGGYFVTQKFLLE